MKTITEYQCEICYSKYPTPQVALACEAKGIFDPSMYPPGLMYEYHHHDYIGIFAIVPWNPDEITKHWGKLVSWACRAPNYPGDTLGKDMCSSGNYLYSNKDGLDHWKEYYHITEGRLNGPEYKRMVEFLKSMEITPTYYDIKGVLHTV